MSGAFLDLLTYLAQASPDEWHQVAWNWNWDNPSDAIYWIIRQPTCDRGAALLAYWCATSRYFAQYATRDAVPEHELDGHDLVAEIERRYLAGGYTRQEIAYDPREDRGFSEQGYDWTQEYANLPNRRPIPEEMYVASPRHFVACAEGYDEGYPPGVEDEEASLALAHVEEGVALGGGGELLAGADDLQHLAAPLGLPMKTAPTSRFSRKKNLR